MRKRLDRSKMLEFFVNLPPCLIGMEACGSAHYWARKLTVMGHTVKLMAPPFVKPYVKTNKNDMGDAEVICEALSRPNMRFVPVKKDEQQAALALHRVRQSFLKVRTAQANQIRGLLSEFSVIISQGIAHIGRRLAEIMEKSGLPGSFRELLQRLYDHLKALDKPVDEMDATIQQWHRESERSRKLAEIPGIGAIIATALVASIGDARSMKPRQIAIGGGSVNAVGSKPAPRLETVGDKNDAQPA